jgi:hypothetical protein
MMGTLLENNFLALGHSQGRKFQTFDNLKMGELILHFHLAHLCRPKEQDSRWRIYGIKM